MVSDLVFRPIRFGPQEINNIFSCMYKDSLYDIFSKRFPAKQDTQSSSPDVLILPGS